MQRESFEVMFKPICKARGWPAPCLIINETADPDGCYQASALITIEGQCIQADGDRVAWKGATARQAFMRLLVQIDPNADFPREWLNPPKTVPFAVEGLIKACRSRGLAPPRITEVATSSKAHPFGCTLTIGGLDPQNFHGEGYGFGEAKAIAATKALEVVLQMPEQEKTHFSFEGPLDDLIGSVFVSIEPKGWLGDICNHFGWQLPDFVMAPYGNLFKCKATLRFDGKEISAQSRPNTTKAGAQRDLSLMLLKKALPKVIFPLESEVPVPLFQAKTRALECLRRMKLPPPVEKIVENPDEVMRYSCTFSLFKNGNAWTARGYSKDEASAMAATMMAQDLCVAAKSASDSKARTEPALRPKPAAAIYKIEPALKPKPAATVHRSAASTQTQPYSWVSAAYTTLRAALPTNSPKIKLSMMLPGRTEWDLKLESGLVLTLGAAPDETLRLKSVRDKGGQKVVIPERCQSRLVSLSLSPFNLWQSLLEQFIRPIEQVNPPTNAQPAAPLSSVQGIVTTGRLSALPSAISPKSRPEIEADPFVKAASGFFKEGFLAFVDNGDAHCPWSLDSMRRIDWQMGYDYAGLYCAQCGRKNSDGARCAFPDDSESAPKSVTQPLHEGIRSFIARTFGEPENRSQQQALDAAMLVEAAQAIEKHEQGPRDIERLSPKTLCLRCARLVAPPQGLLCLNPGFAGEKLRELEEEGTSAPYKSLALYGLRRTSKSPYWAYAIVTNGTIAQCLDEDIAPYRNHATLIEKTVLTQAILQNRRSNKL